MNALRLSSFLLVSLVTPWTLGCAGKTSGSSEIDSVSTEQSVGAHQAALSPLTRGDGDTQVIDHRFTKLDIGVRTAMNWPKGEGRWVEIDAGSVDSTDVETKWCVRVSDSRESASQCGIGRQPRYSDRGIAWQPPIGFLAPAHEPTVLSLERESHQVEVVTIPPAQEAHVPARASAEDLQLLTSGLQIFVSVAEDGMNISFWMVLGQQLAHETRGLGGTIEITDGLVTTRPIEFWTRGGLAGKRADRWNGLPAFWIKGEHRLNVRTHPTSREPWTATVKLSGLVALRDLDAVEHLGAGVIHVPCWMETQSGNSK